MTFYNKNKDKLNALLQWLQSQGITDYIENMVDENGLKIDLYLPSQNIAVHLSDGHNQSFYVNTCKDYRPFFIYGGDTAEFVIEKMQNCLAGKTCRTAGKHKKQDPRPNIKKRQRVRISVQRVTLNNK